MVVVTAAAAAAAAIPKNAVDNDANASASTVLLAFGVGFSFQLGLDHDSAGTDKNGEVADAVGGADGLLRSASTAAAEDGVAGTANEIEKSKEATCSKNRVGTPTTQV